MIDLFEPPCWCGGRKYAHKWGVSGQQDKPHEIKIAPPPPENLNLQEFNRRYQ
jgi:hypothetical protein